MPGNTGVIKGVSTKLLYIFLQWRLGSVYAGIPLPRLPLKSGQIGRDKSIYFNANKKVAMFLPDFNY